MGWTNMRRCLIIILICILLLAAINEVLFKSVSSNDFVVDSGDTENLPISTPSEPEKTPLSENVNNKNGYSTGNHQILENYPKYDKFPHTKTDPIVHPIVPNISEIDEHFNDEQEQINNNLLSNKLVTTPPEVEDAKILQNINEIDGYFTENWGQIVDKAVRYYIQGAGVWFLDDGVTFKVFENQDKSSNPQNRYKFNNMGFNYAPQEVAPRKSVVIKLKFDDANPVIPQGYGLLSHKSNFFYGNDSSKWCSNVPNYREIIYRNLYDYIDLRYYSTSKGLKYDFIVHLGGDPNDIKLNVEGAITINIDDEENIEINTELGKIQDCNIYIYQITKNGQQSIQGKFKILDSMTYGFELLVEYDKTKDIIIDPLIYSTFIGGGGSDWGYDIAIDLEENAYLTGQTFSFDFPTTPGAYNRTHSGNFINNTNMDIFVCKLNKNGSALIYSTFIGGIVNDYSSGITVDNHGNVFVIGYTISSDFPVTPNGYDTSFNGVIDIFVLKLNANGSALSYSTYLGGNRTNINNDSGNEYGYDIAIDAIGNAYITGCTSSINFPITSNAYDVSFNGYLDVFVAKFNPNGSTLLYSTFIGGNKSDIGYDIAMDLENNVFVTGITNSPVFPTTQGVVDTSLNDNYSDCFIFKLNLTNSKLIYSTYIGGNSSDLAFGIDLDSKGNAYITGITGSIDFPTTPGALNNSYVYNISYQEAFVLKLNANGSSIIYSTYLGGNSYDHAWDIIIDNKGNAYITGITYSPNFPVTSNAFDTSYNGVADAFIVILNQNGSALIYSSYIGGHYPEWGVGNELDSKGNLYITGYTTSSDFPTTPGAYDTSINNVTDCYVLKINFSTKNTPPKILNFTATHAPEGSKVIFIVNASDPENDTLTYSFDFQDDGIFNYVGKNNTVSYTWGDDFRGTAVVRVSDGNLSVEVNTSVVIINSKPIVNSITLTNVTKISQNATREWITKYKSSSSYGGGVASAITADLYGYVYITGHVGSNETHDDYLTIKFDTYGNKLWENRYNGPANWLDWPNGIDVDLAGNVYVTGKSSSNGSGWDFATVAYNSVGKELWVMRYNGPGNGQDSAEAIAITPSGNIVVTGGSRDKGANYNCTTIAYDRNGNELWVARYNSPRFSSSEGYEIDLDAYGNVYIGGCGITKGLNYDYIIIKYNSKGYELWSKYYNGVGNSYDFLFDMKVNENGNVYVTGRSEGNGTGADYATLKYDTNGTCQWVARYNGPGNAYDLARGIDIDPKENVFVTGYSDSGTGHDFATIAYNSSGKQLWVARYNGPGNGHDNAYAIAVDSLSNVYVTGLSFGNRTYDDIATVAYNAKGDGLWVERYNGPANHHDGSFAMTTDSMENIYIAGYITDIGARSDNIVIKYSTLKCYNCDEGISLSFNASGFDPGSDDLNFTWDWGDSSKKLSRIYYNNNKSQDPYPSPGGTFPVKRTDSATYTYGDDGVYLIKLNLSDDDGGLTTYKLRIIVNNFPPKIKVIKPQVINEGKYFNLSATATDPGSDDLKFNWTLENGPNFLNVYYNNGLGLDPYPSPNGTFPFFANDTINHTYFDNGTYSVTLTVTDDDNSTAIRFVNITVLDLSPMANAGPDHWIDTKENITFNASKSYSYPDKIVKYLWDFGDRTNLSGLEVNHSYSYCGIFTVTLTVIDEDGSIDNDTAIVYVNETKHWCGYIAYEDLKKQNWCDYDYNDWGMMMYVKRDYNCDGNLTSIRLEFIGMLKEAGYNHEIFMGIRISENVNYTWSIRHYNRTDYMFWKESGSDSGDLNITIFNFTGKNVGYSSVVKIDFQNPVNPSLVADIPFDPYMYVFNTKEEIHVGYNQTISIKDAKGSNPFIGLNESPLILIIELDDWAPPKECQRIWKAYPYFDDWIYSKRTKYLDWYKNPA